MQIKLFTEIVTDVLAEVGTRTGITNFNVGSVVRTLAEALAFPISELYVFAADVLRAAFLDTAEGSWLDRKVSEFGITRLAAVKTEGVVTFARNVVAATNITIPAGTIVATPKDQSGTEYRYFTTEEGILLSGEASVEIPVIAEAAGNAYNAGPGSISVLKTVISGVNTVSNVSDPETGTWMTTVGADEESDSWLRHRAYMAWEELAMGGTAAAYVSWALSVAGVKSAFVDDNLPRGDGTVDVYIMGEAGPPDAALIEAVQTVVDANRPITADALVASPEIVSVPITMTVVPRIGYDVTAMETEIRRRISVFFSDVEDATLSIPILGVGKDVVVSQIVGVVMSVAGIYSVVVDAPAADLVVAPNQFPEQGAVTITMGAPSYE